MRVQTNRSPRQDGMGAIRPGCTHRTENRCLAIRPRQEPSGAIYFDTRWNGVLLSRLSQSRTRTPHQEAQCGHKSQKTTPSTRPFDLFHLISIFHEFQHRCCKTNAYKIPFLIVCEPDKNADDVTSTDTSIKITYKSELRYILLSCRLNRTLRDF